MATQGWRHYAPPPRAGVSPHKGRRTVVQMVADREDERLERELLAEVERWLDAEVAAYRLMCWYHRPDRKPREQDREHAGLPDLIIGLRPGAGLRCIELKRPNGTGRLSPEQERWLEAAGNAGAVCTSLEQVRSAVREWRAAT